MIPAWRKVGEVWHLNCDSTAGFLACEAVPRSGLIDSSETGRAAFSETASFAAALQMVREGWPEGADLARKLAATLTGAVSDVASRLALVTHYDVAGDECDLGRHFSGDPESMMSWETEAVPGVGRILKLIVNGTASSQVKASIMIQAAALVGALADALEAAGLRVEIEIRYKMDGSTKKNEGVEIVHLVKRSEDALDLGRLTAAIHPAAFRRLGFRWLEQLPQITNTFGYAVRLKDVDGVALDLAELTGHKDQAGWLAGKVKKLTAAA